jgi:hypothetical protein
MVRVRWVGRLLAAMARGELPAYLGQSAMTPFAWPGRHADPAESFLLTHFANALADTIAGTNGW